MNNKMNGRIGLMCNTLNAQQSLSNHLYSQTGNKRENDLSIILRNAQSLIWELNDELDRVKGGIDNGNSR